MNCDQPKKTRSLVLWLSVCLLALAATVLGCGWEVGSEHSVRFNPARTAKQFSRLPPLPKYNSAESNRLFSWDRDENTMDRYEEQDHESDRINKLWERAVQAETEQRLGEVRQLLQQYLYDTQPERWSRWMGVRVQERRNTAIDKLDALGEVDHGASKAAISEYLAARSEYDGARRPDEVAKHLKESCRDARLRDNAGYLAAALDIKYGAQAVTSFERLAARYPTSEKREAALYMAALIAMKLSQSYLAEHPGSALKDSCDDCRDPYWRRARAAFEHVLKEYPDGRYHSDARGWLGYLGLIVGDRAGALVEYYRLLGEKNEAGRVEALFSLCLVRHRADEAELERVEKVLEHEPAAALAYAYHSIYNFALRSDSQRWFYEDYNSFKDETDDERASRRRHEIERTASFAGRMMNRFPSSAVGAGFIVRVAEADLELNRDSDASRLARRALTSGAGGDIRAEALWIAGVSEFRRHQFAAARRALQTLIAENPNNRYTEGARRQLAMLEEDTGNLDGALDQYIALDYRDDIAYFVDVLMTSERLAAYISKRPPSDPRGNELLYALGIRYLRERRWNDARATFSRVKTLARDADESYLSRHNLDSWRRKESPKERDFDPSIFGVRPNWIAEDMRTANELERLEREVEAATTDDAKAEALYQVASYQYERSLLFYNPLEWHGVRHYLLEDLDERGAFRQPNESQMLFNYMQKHDMASSSLPLFLEVVRRYPNTRAARDALFTAAVCHERLHGYNNYWGNVYTDDGHAGPRMVTYLDVRSAYPRYRLPRGTSGWQPSTRTVNDGPGWDPLPKPKPRPSRWSRIERLANLWSTESFRLFDRILDDVEYLLKQTWLAIVAALNWIGHWLWIIAMCCWLWFLWRRTREARVLMNEVLSRCNTRPAEERLESNTLLHVTPSTAVLKRYLNQDIRAAWMESIYEIQYKMNQVLRDKRGISVTAFYVATHGLFIALLLRLLVNW